MKDEISQVAIGRRIGVLMLKGLRVKRLSEPNVFSLFPPMFPSIQFCQCLEDKERITMPVKGLTVDSYIFLFLYLEMLWR